MQWITLKVRMAREVLEKTRQAGQKTGTSYIFQVEIGLELLPLLLLI